MKTFVLPVLTSIFLGLGFLWLGAEEDVVAPDSGNTAPAQNTLGETDPFAPGNPVVEIPVQVQVQVEFIELSHETLTELLYLHLPKSADATPLRKQLHELIAKKEAKVLETQILVCRSGEKATSESIHEFIYPTEYDPPNHGNISKKMEEQMKHYGNIPYNPVSPTAYETRNLGCEIEIEPNIDDTKRLIDLRFIPRLLWHTGDTVWHEGKDSDGNPFKQSMPDFYKLQMEASITCLNGQYNFVGTVSPKDSKGEVDMTRKVMIFVKCDVLTVK